MTVVPSEQLNGLFVRARAMCSDWPMDDVQFDVLTGWAQNYGDLFAGRFTRILREDEILNTVMGRGRAILAGRAGDGKTWLLRRLYKRVLDRGDLPILLDLKQWTGGDYNDWADWTSNAIGDAADFLMRRFGGIELGAADLDRLPPRVSKILLVDGLNEITSAVGAQVLQLLDELVRNQINLTVFVADRLIRRDLPNPLRWSIGTPRPLSVEQVMKHLGRVSNVQANGILTSPFFLDAALKYHVEGHRRSEASERFLTVHGGLKEAELDAVAAAAFAAYQSSRSRVFSRAAFIDIAGIETTTALELSHVLVPMPGGKSYFLHHLLHDYLAARHLAKLPSEDWTSQALSEISFDSSSFDAIELVFEQSSGQKADLFLRRLYDWNLYAAGYALGQARDGDESVSLEMRTMIFAMLAEKRFDAVLTTRQRAGDALALMQLSDAKPFCNAENLEAVFSALDKISSTEAWFNEWKGVYRTGQDVELSESTIETIRSPDSIIGWTVANVAKRSIVNERLQELISSWIQDEGNATVRWRIAHVLGAFRTESASSLLISLLDDEDHSVRYGAIRSLIELSARAEQKLRSAVADAISTRALDVSKQPRISGELRSCLLMHEDMVPTDWLLFVQKVVRAMFIVIEDTGERDLWRGCLGKAEDLYASKRTPPERHSA